MLDEKSKALDSANMYRNIGMFPGQIRAGIKIGQETYLGGMKIGGLRKIILAGMGGSAIGGDLIRSLIRNESKIPFEIHRNYGLPSYADSETLLICSSYSGTTEETLSSFNEGIKRGCRIICVSTGGELAKLAGRAEVPCAIIPSGFPPRAALGYSFAVNLVVLGRLNICRDYSAELAGAAELLENQNRAYSYESTDNFAFSLAKSISGKIPIIYAGADLLETTALRFKGQICENAKQLAFCNVFPEFNHNELVGWQLPSGLDKQFIVIILRDISDNPQTIKRMDIIEQILTEKQIGIINLEGSGQYPLARMLSLIQLADYCSFYIALLNGVDPTPIDVINFLKRKLAEN
jgi:glucose/mannose-6-phosphate isomerase